MDEMSRRIEKALPIVKSYLKRHPVPKKVYEEVFQTLRISLWKTIKKQETTHQGWKLVHLFEWMAKSDLKQEYYLEKLIPVPHRKLYDKQWQEDNMPHIYWPDDAEGDIDVIPDSEMSPERELMFLESISSLTDKEQFVLDCAIHSLT